MIKLNVERYEKFDKDNIYTIMTRLLTVQQVVQIMFNSAHCVKDSIAASSQYFLLMISTTDSVI